MWWDTQQVAGKKGLTGKVYNWFKSYLTGQTMSVKINNEFSNPVLVNSGVPQGSVLCPILLTFMFVLFINTLNQQVLK